MHATACKQAHENACFKGIKGHCRPPMPKGVSFKVRKDPARPSPWYINVPAGLSPTGKRQRLYFATRNLALGEAERLKNRHANFGVSLGNLNSAQIVEAADCFEQLEAHLGVSLSE